MMKILFVLEHYYPNVGGVEVLFKTLCEGLAKKGHKVEIITSRLPNTKKQEVINGVKIKRISVPQIARRYFFSVMSIPKVLKLAKKFDIIHAGTYNGGLPAIFAKWLLKKPTIITYHEAMHTWKKDITDTPFLLLKLYHLIEKIIIKQKFDKFVCVSYSTKKELNKLGLCRKKAEVIHNPVDYNVFNPAKYKGARTEIRKKLGIKNNEFLYVFYGRPGVSKGPEYLINAIPKITKDIKNSKCLLIMGNEPKDRYIQMKKLIKKNANNNVILHKSVPYKELPKYLLAADCIVIPSLKEGFGYCVAESCALGKPIVATNTTSIPEVVSGKFILVPPKNSFAIAKALKFVKEKKYMKTPLKMFTEKDCIKKYEELYQKLYK